jgi:hypothetical protein
VDQMSSMGHLQLHASYIDLSIFLNLVASVYGYEVSGFGESVHDHPN